ncbi:alpha/beta hydrolase [Cryptosporangium arvum]|uniref:Alpha/beta hydrolase family protein n=1 Tax=Cryptosporangium arvum DSM 44712 TaxID=927661 RepID=A0A011AAU3_9ACTN|nr:alpha/beta hydrolase [Cryptosporangium arvum]EXG79146.1 alpha/beta hydrolase family protein [Cryptosporangium arvum DSM 44712]
MGRRSALAVVGIALAGLISPALVSPAVAAPLTAPQAQAPAPITWTACATETYPTLQCGKVSVPLDYDNPSGRKITLAVSRIPHTAAKSQGALLVNPGGPGGSGLSLAGFVAKNLPKDVAAQYDVIGFDPRGVGKSEPALNCAEGFFKPVRPDSVPKTKADMEANLKRVKSLAAKCGAKYGSLLKYIDTLSAVKDMDQIRLGLGAKTINYFGYSYGTYLGAVYAKLFPKNVRRMVLDSVVDPTGVWYEDNLQQDYAFDARHEAFAAWVAKHDANYHLGTSEDVVLEKWYATRAALKAKPAGGVVGPSEFEDTYIPGGYYNGYWPFLADALAAYVNNKDEAALVDVFEAFGAVDASGENGFSIYAAVQCRDAKWPKNWSTWVNDNWEVYKKAPFMAWNNAWYNAPCAFWPVKSLHPIDVSNSKVESVLIFQATDDAATPYPGAEVVRRKIKNSRLVVEQDGGNHGITLSGNACLDKYLADYLATGARPEGSGIVDATCAALPDPEPPAATAQAGSTAKAASRAGRGTLHEYVATRPVE